MATNTEYTRGWVAVQAMTQNGTGIGATTGDEYGSRDSNHYWNAEVTGGVNMTKFLGYERNYMTATYTSNSNQGTAAFTPPAAQMTAWNSEVATITSNDKPLISQNQSNSQVPGHLIYGSFNNTLVDNGSFQGNSALNAGPTLSNVQLATYTTAQIGWNFTAKPYDTLPVSGVVGPWARGEEMWDNGNYGSNRIGQNAV